MTDSIEIKYASRHCLAPDQYGQIAQHIARHYTSFFEPSGCHDSGVSVAEQLSCEPRQPIVLPQWNPEPRLGLYQFYDPSGWSRPGKIFVLLEEEAVDAAGQDWKFFEVSGDVDGLPEILIRREMQISRRLYLADGIVLCELQDLRRLWRNSIFSPTFPAPPSLSLSQFVDTLSALGGYFDKPEISWAAVNVDLKSLWRPGARVTHLLDAACGANTASPYYRTSPNDTITEIDYAGNGDGAGTHTVETFYPRQLHGVARNDVSGYYGLLLNNGNGPSVTCSAPAVVLPASPTVAINSAELYALSLAISAMESVPGGGPAYLRRITSADPDENRTLDNFNVIDSTITDLNGNGGAIAVSFVPAIHFPLQRHYYWLGDTKPTCEPMDVIRIQLLENMPVCSDAAALHSSNLPSESCPCEFVRQVLVRDTAGIARTKIQNGQRFAPAQSMGFARHLACSDTGEMDVYELVSIGQGCCPPPGSSDYQECCEPWFTRFENLASVTEKAVGAEIAYGETIGQLKGTGETAYLIYKAYLSSSDVANGCAIDLSGIHSFEARNSRTSGTSPCTPSFSQCAIDYALLKMSGRLPVASGPPCGADPASLWYEDLSAAGTGDDYHERTIKADPGSCAISKKVYNFTSVRTTVLTKGADYVVLKHWCDPTSSSSSSGVDDCCAQFTDYDMRCVGGVLQRWSRQYEVCWNGDCLETRILHYWQPTGETVGCCDCGSGVSSSSSSGPTEPPGCVDGVTVVLPGTGYQSGGPLWDIVSASYDMATGNWSVTATANANAGTAPSCGAYYVCDEVFNAASNPVVTNCTLGNSTTQNGPFCQGATVTITGTSTPPTAANCSTWEIAIKSWATPFLSIYFDCAACPDPI
jgi:hypothetical protein